ncbi:MAG: sensor histidine kinase [Anaerolineaceae bacterium]|nr:sensor histidine kinase [Anaerolineaceae bacterium]MDD4042467.1 sensor histidine kinase [Anaerolineaceae bacterium]MDD4578592.1 sensor histidine kinase [Anaerolineaceae bacterium]
MKRPLEPGLLRLFRYFSLIGLLYFSARWVYDDVSVTRTAVIAFQSVYYVIIHGFLFLSLSFSWLERKLKDKYFPLILIGYTLAMVGGSWLYLLEPNRGITHFISQSYSLVPILIVPVVFIAWQYDYRSVLLYTIVTNLSDFIITFLIIGHVTLESVPLLTLPVVRAFAFALVGFIVDQLNEKQREQKHKLVLANMQLGQYANTLESLATSRERNRLARELHDTLAHTLSGISVNLEALKTMVPDDQTEVTAMLDNSLTASRRGLDGTRRALNDLRAQPLEDLGLELALQTLVESLVERHEMLSEIHISNLVQILPPNIEQAFYRIAQESLENISMHASANRIFFSLQEEEGIVRMEIRDNGVGFNPLDDPGPGHYGLRGMQERATSIGADLEVTSQPVTGTIVRLSWERYI